MSLLRFGSAMMRSSALQTGPKTLFKMRGLESFIDPKLRDENQMKPIRTGRAWKAEELRKKSFEDLHKLWFVFIKEKNVLLTERDNLGRQKARELLIPSRLLKVRQGMARLLTVISERTNAFKKQKKIEALKSTEAEVPAETEAPSQTQ